MEKISKSKYKEICINTLISFKNDWRNLKYGNNILKLI